MKRLNQRGTVHVSVIVAIMMTMLFFAATTFGFWALAGKNDYKFNTDKKIEAAVAVEKQKVESSKDNEFAEKEKSPVKSYSGSSTFGSVSFDYPKTYSAYVIESTNGDTTPVNGYYQPNIVPAVSDVTVSFALRLQIVNGQYADLIKQFDSQVKAGKVTVKPFRAAKQPDTLGIRIDGELTTGKQGSMIMIPLRDKTLKLSTEGTQYTGDFNTYVIPSLNFIP